MKKLFASAVLALFLTACALAPQSPAQAVYQAKTDYAIALTAAVAYKRLPPCPTASKVCSDPKIVKQLQAADTAAAALLDGAEVTVRQGGGNAQMAITAAQQAVAALTSVTKLLGSK